MASTKEMQARARAKKIAALKAESAKKMLEFKSVFKDHNYLTISIELNGAVNALHQWAAPPHSYQLVEGKSSVLRDISGGIKDTREILGNKLSDAEIRLLATATYVCQGAANGIMSYGPKGQAHMMIAEVLRRGTEGYEGVSKIEVSMTTMPSPMSMIGVAGDKFIPGFGEKDYIRLLDTDDNVIAEFTAANIKGNKSQEEMTEQSLNFMLKRAMNM